MRVEGAPLGDLSDMVWMADLPAYWAERQPHARAFIFDDRTWTYADLDAASKRLVRAWRAAGLKPGDHVAHVGRNNELFYAAFFACARAGLVFVPINWRFASAELKFVISDCAPRIVIHDADFADNVRAACADLARMPELIATEGASGLRGLATSGALDGERVPLSFNAPFLQLYTSGTTGRPKGATLSHGAVSLTRHGDKLTPQWEDWTPEDIVLCAMPNFHIAGIGFVTHALAAGAACVHTADPSPPSLIALGRKHGVTRAFMVPTILRMYLDELKQRGERAPPLKTLCYGASPMSPALLEEATAALGCRFGQYYGMTETSGTGTFLGGADHDPSRAHLMRSVGKPFAGVSVEIRRPDNSVCDAMEPGEICIRSRANMLGYANRPEATAEVLQGEWYRTGDGGYLDNEGYLFLTDRIRDLIISGGENVYPVEIENVLREHPAINEVAVVGLPHDKWGEAVTAVVELRPRLPLSLEEVRSFARERLAGYKLPQSVFVAEQLPRTASGKVQRNAAKALIPNLKALT
ncbi:MAG: AMP-binding protein [Hyphomonadaceae bacterium]|mgnify:CR=1 FL=1|nr:AMP-binding protein [Hyphomonadaceae bacterium]